MHTTYKNLIVYKKAKQLTVDLAKEVYNKKYKYNQSFILNQLLRASSSVGANIAEGYGRHYKKSYRNYISIARGSSFETDYWLELVLELRIFDNKTIVNFQNRNLELIKMLTVMMKNLSDDKQHTT